MEGLRSRLGIAAPPFTKGPYTWDQFVTFSGGIAGANVTGNIIYVDGTNGSDSNSGHSWGEAKATIQGGVTAAGANGVVYVNPKLITDLTGDPTNYAETIIIPVTHTGLSLIGINRGRTQGGLPQIKIGTGTTAMITVRAAGCLIANMGFNGTGSTGGGILLDDDYATKIAFGTSIINCHFKNCKGHATTASLGGAIMWSDQGNAWQVYIGGNRFYKNVCDICLKGTSSTRPQDVIIEHNHFAAGATSSTCIWGGGSGFGDGFVVYNNTFGNVPSLGSGSERYFCGLGNDLNGTGIMSNNTFGAAGTITGYGANKATAKIGTGILLSNNYSSAGLIVREA